MEQAMMALERANVVRYAQAELKRDIREGVLTAVEALDDPRLGGITVFQLLSCQPKIGRGKIKRIGVKLRAEGAWCSMDSRVRDLSVRDKAVLRMVLEGPGRSA